MKREKTEVELSWENGKFEKDLKDLDTQITKEIWAHDKRQFALQREDFAWKGILTGISVFFGILVAVSKAYFPKATDMLAEVSLMALIPGLMAVYTWRNPAGKRAIHIIVSGQKADTQGKINLQLIQKTKHRELAESFYRWIHSEFARVGGTNGAYLSGNLLSGYPESDDDSDSDSDSSSESDSDEELRVAASAPPLGKMDDSDEEKPLISHPLEKKDV
jgi:hypothetical protein